MKFYQYVAYDNFYYDVILVSESDTEDQDMAQDQDMSEGEPSEIELSGDEESRDVASRIRDRAGIQKLLLNNEPVV